MPNINPNKTYLSEVTFSAKHLVTYVGVFALLCGIYIYSSMALNPNLPGDVNGDNIVDSLDLSLLLKNYDSTTYKDADFNNSGKVDVPDLSVLLTNYGKSYTPTETWPPNSAYFYDDFTNGWSKWLTEGSISFFAIVDDGTGGKALQLTVDSSSSGPNASSELASVYLAADKSHSGYQKINEETWYRHGIKFPRSSYTPTTGEWNWLVEWHTDTKTQSAGGNSTSLGVLTDYPVSTNPGNNPRLNLRIGTGSSSSPTYKYFSLPSNSLKYDYWYDSVYHVIWSTDQNIGLFEWWLDGELAASYRGPTLYRNLDGTISYNTFGLYNYRLHASWGSSVQFKDIIIGPTRSSIGL